MWKFIIYVLSFCMLVNPFLSTGQDAFIPIEELTKQGNDKWFVVERMASKAKNKVEVLPTDSSHAASSLLHSQLPLNTTLGAVIFNCGGILIDNGWIRILGSGSQRLPRSVPDWNAGKLSIMRNSDAFYLLVADDVMGGLFAIKASSIEELENIGQVFYFGPNSLSWQSTGLSYKSFLSFCFSGNLKEFYEDFRWKGWQEEVQALDCNTVISCYPLLWTREGLQMKANRKPLSIQAQWNLYQGKPKVGRKQKAVAQRSPQRSTKPPPTQISMWTQ